MSPVFTLFKYITSILVVGLMSFVGCTTSEVENIEFEIQNKDINITTLSVSNYHQRHLILKPEMIYGSFTDILAIDSFLVCGNLRSNKIISIFSLKGDSLVTEIIQRGVASNEGLSVAGFSNQYTATVSDLWVYDITFGKLFQINILKAIKDTSYIPERQIILPPELRNIVSPKIINDRLIIATTYALDDNRYLYANSKIVKKVGVLPEVNNSRFLKDAQGAKFPNKAKIFKAYGVKHPVDDKIVVFYCKTDRIEFYTEDVLTKTIVGPDVFSPRMDIERLDSGFSVTDSDKTKYSYSSVAYTISDIYCLYSGTAKDDGCSNRIFVFGWDGTFKGEILLDKQVCKICIDPNTNVLYCYEASENQIYSAKLN